MMSTTVSKNRRPAYFTVRQAAGLIGVQSSTIWRAIRLGTVRTARVRSRLVVHARDVERLLDDTRGGET